MVILYYIMKMISVMAKVSPKKGRAIIFNGKIKHKASRPSKR